MGDQPAIRFLAFAATVASLAAARAAEARWSLIGSIVVFDAIRYGFGGPGSYSRP